MEALIRGMLAGVTIYAIDQEIKEEAIRLRRESRLKLPDAIIVSTAICRHAILVTNDAELRKIAGPQSRKLALRQ